MLTLSQSHQQRVEEQRQQWQNGLADPVLEADLIMVETRERTSKTLRKLQSHLRCLVGRAIRDYAMIEAGDRVMVCLSGGKDSYTMLDLLLSLRRRAPVRFEILAVNLNQKQPGFPEQVLPEYLSALGVPFRIVEEDTYSVVKRIIAEGKTMCSLCSRLRRGVLYRVAQAEGITKIALGHHRDDMVETLFLNMFHRGQLKAMAPKFISDDQRNIVIRPLAYCPEADIARYAKAREFPIIPCKLCGSQENLQRVQIKQMLQTWEQENPGRIDSLFHSLQTVVPAHLADTQLYDFVNLGRETKGSPQSRSEDTEDPFVFTKTTGWDMVLEDHK